MSSPGQAEEFSFPVPRAPTHISQLRKQVKAYYMCIIVSLSPFLPDMFVPLFLKLVLLQNPLTSRATVVDCSDRQNGAATPIPKPASIPQPKLKPDVRPGKVSRQLLRSLSMTKQH